MNKTKLFPVLSILYPLLSYTPPKDINKDVKMWNLFENRIEM
jgi:hypothetical protein